MVSKKEIGEENSRANIYSKNKSARRRLISIGAIYIIAVYVTYLLAGIGLIWFQGILITLGLALYLGVIVGIILLIFGLLEIKDFFWYGRGLSLAIPVRFTSTIKAKAAHVTGLGAIVLGVFVAMVELPCTGGPYLAITAILASKFDLLAFYYLLLYNFIFVLPLIIIVFLAAFGVKYEKMKAWKQSQKKWMRLIAGILLISFGVFIISYYLGFVNIEYLGVDTSGGAITLEGLTLPVVIGTAIIDSVNPCAIGVLLLLVATLVSISRAEKIQIKKSIE
ncbi:MAG: cytochrome c biogenesis protein CcdA [Candidatus Aenigmatarchaeota archaeon]